MNKGLIIGIVVLILVVGGGIYYMLSNSDVYNDTSSVPAGSLGSDANTPENTNSNPSIPSTSAPNILEVKIESFSFSPIVLNVKAGDTVKWTNLDSVAHTVTSDSGSELDSELFSKGQTYSHTFTVAGVYEYHCAPHPRMKAKIIVS